LILGDPSIRCDREGKREAPEYGKRQSVFGYALGTLCTAESDVYPVEGEVANDDGEE
jgi:hypothetical protein